MQGNLLAVGVAHQYDNFITLLYRNTGRIVQVAVFLGHQFGGPLLWYAVRGIFTDAEFFFMRIVSIVLEGFGQSDEIVGEGIDLFVGHTFFQSAASDIIEYGEQRFFQGVFLVVPIELHFVAAYKIAGARFYFEFDTGDFLGGLEGDFGRCILHAEIVGTIFLPVRVLLIGSNQQVKFSEVSVSGAGIINKVVYVGTPLEIIFQCDWEVGRFPPW